MVVGAWRHKVKLARWWVESTGVWISGSWAADLQLAAAPWSRNPCEHQLAAATTGDSNLQQPRNIQWFLQRWILTSLSPASPIGQSARLPDPELNERHGSRPVVSCSEKTSVWMVSTRTPPCAASPAAGSGSPAPQWSQAGRTPGHREDFDTSPLRKYWIELIKCYIHRHRCKILRTLALSHVTCHLVVYDGYGSAPDPLPGDAPVGPPGHHAQEPPDSGLGLDLHLQRGGETI